ncbi:hypothetical protein ACVIJ1_002527 [Bradyrhizobium elkanii]
MKVAQQIERGEGLRSRFHDPKFKGAAFGIQPHGTAHGLARTAAQCGAIVPPSLADWGKINPQCRISLFHLGHEPSPAGGATGSRLKVRINPGEHQLIRAVQAGRQRIEACRHDGIGLLCKNTVVFDEQSVETSISRFIEQPARPGMRPETPRSPPANNRQANDLA